MNVQHVDLVAGDDRTMIFTAKDHNQVVVNLAGATISWRAARCLGGAAVVSKSGSIVSAGAGTFSVALTDADTESLCGDYVHQAKVTIGSLTAVAVQGRFRVRKQVKAGT